MSKFGKIFTLFIDIIAIGLMLIFAQFVVAFVVWNELKDRKMVNDLEDEDGEAV